MFWRTHSIATGHRSQRTEDDYTYKGKYETFPDGHSKFISETCNGEPFENEFEMHPENNEVYLVFDDDVDWDDELRPQKRLCPDR